MRDSHGIAVYTNCQHGDMETVLDACALFHDRRWPVRDRMSPFREPGA